MRAEGMLWGAAVFLLRVCLGGLVQQIRLDWQLDQLNLQIEHLAGQARRFEAMANEWE